MFSGPKPTLPLQGILFTEFPSNIIICVWAHTHTIWTCTFCFSGRNGLWMAVWRLWNGPETSVRKVFLLHLWPNSLQELQVSLHLLEQEGAPTRGGPGPGKQRSWGTELPVFSGHVLLTFSVPFANVIWCYWEITGVLHRIGGTPERPLGRRPLYPNPLCAGHLCTDIWIKRWWKEHLSVPEHLEICIFLMGLPGTHCQALGFRGHLVTEGWLSWFLRDIPVLPFCYSFIHCAPVYSSEHKAGNRKFGSLGRSEQTIWPTFSIYIHPARL